MVDGIDNLIPEKILERRSDERRTLPISQVSLKGKVIIQEEKQVRAEAGERREGLVLSTDGSRTEN